MTMLPANGLEFNGHYWQPDELNDVLAECDQLIDLYLDHLKKWAGRKLAAVKSGDKEAVKEAHDIEGAIAKKIAHLRRRRYRKDVLILAAAGQKSLGISGREWDRDPYLLPFQNGILDLRTLQFRPGRPDDYIQTVCPIAWRGLDAPATKWIEFLLEVFEGDSSTRRLLAAAPWLWDCWSKLRTHFANLMGPGRQKWQGYFT